jgi:hypothetical protein
MPEGEGRWVEIELPPYATRSLYCHACGAMIPKRYWDIGLGERRAYCGPPCEALERRVEELARRFPVAARPDAASAEQ